MLRGYQAAVGGCIGNLRIVCRSEADERRDILAFLFTAACKLFGRTGFARQAEAGHIGVFAGAFGDDMLHHICNLSRALF